MGVLFGDGVANFVVVFCSIVLMTRHSMAAKLLEGLKVFQARKADENSKEVRPEGLSGKQAKRQAKAAAKQSIYVEGAEQIVRIAMPATSFLKAHYMEEFEALINGAVLLLGNVIVVASPLLGYRLASYTWLIWMGCLVPFLVGYALSKVEVLTEGVTREDKLLVISLAICLSLAAGLLLEFLPAQYLDFQWDSATAELGWLVTSVRRKLDIHMMTVPNITVPESVLKCCVAVAAGILSSLLTPAAVRMGRCSVLANDPPPATRQYLGFGAFKTALMQLAVGLPAVGALFWVRPMLQDLLHLSDGSVKYSRAAFLLLLAATQAAATRSFVQAYLNSALVIWWTQKHAMTSWDKKSNMGEWIRMRIDHVNAVACKVAVEIAAPAVLWLSCAALLIFAAFKDGTQPEGWTQIAFPWNAIYKMPGEGAWVPHSLLSCVWGFVAWWTCLWWFLSSSFTIGMLRNGLLAGR